MKLVTEKKPSLAIFSINRNGDLDDAPSNEKKMEAELRSVKCELEATQIALKTQRARCQHLVAAFASKLQEKEGELRASHILREQQLSRLLRSLLVLEARLRKEQKEIRTQLLAKDAIIAEQEKEITELKRNDPRSFRDNPVLESVNQILLQDEDDLLENGKAQVVKRDSSEAGGAWYETDVVPPKDPEAWCIKVEEGDQTSHSEVLWVKDRSPVTKAQVLEEKAVLQMAKKTLTLAVAKDLEEVDVTSSVGANPSESSYQELNPVLYEPVKPLKPPALPPKPLKLLKPSEILRKKPPTQPKPHEQEIKRKLMSGHVPGNAKVAFQTDPHNRGIKIGHSVSSLILLHQGPTEATEASLDSFVPKKEDLNENAPPDSNELQQNFEEFKLEESYAEVDRAEADGAETSHYTSIMAPTTTTTTTTTILPTTAETTTTATAGINGDCSSSTRTYETFLESTGLSQKSILTPSRMLSNHRSCLKPKDVKHRSKIVKAAATNGSTVKYWTEPYL